jgi:hypothetical protein
MTNLLQQAIDCDDADHAAKLTQDALAARGAPCSTR